MIRVAVVIGNPKPMSRTRQIAEALVSKLLVPGRANVEVIDLSDHMAEVFAWPSPVMTRLTEQVAVCDLAVFASPTYKATYTGLLKAFLDRYPSAGLTGTVAIPVHTGADRTHAMGVDVNLAPLLVELGAVVPGAGLYFETSRMDEMDRVVDAAASSITQRLQSLATVATYTRGSTRMEQR